MQFSHGWADFRASTSWDRSHRFFAIGRSSGWDNGRHKYLGDWLEACSDSFEKFGSLLGPFPANVAMMSLIFSVLGWLCVFLS